MYSVDNIYIYIFCWKKVVANSLALYSKISRICPNTILINCDENTKLNAEDIKHIQLDDTYYYGSQFETAIKNAPTGSIVACITGDVSIEANWNGIIDNAIAAFNTEKIGIYAPNVYYTYWTSRKHQLWDDLWEVENTDCTVWFIHPSIIDILRPIPFGKVSNLGWGIDVITISECNSQKLLVARDYSIKVDHPHDTAYNQSKALEQMHALNKVYEEYKKLNNT